MGKYIYLLEIRFRGGIVDYCYLENDIFNDFYYSYEEAVSKGKSIIKESINKHLSYLDIDYCSEEDIIKY